MALSDPVWLIALKLGAVLFLVFLNGFFVAAEFAIVKVRATQLATHESAGKASGRRAQNMVEHMDAYLSATQLGITLASLGLGWIGEPAIATLVEPMMASFGVTSATVVHSASFAIAFGLITFLHIVFGELAPKSLAIQKPRGVTLGVARPLHIFYLIFKPAIVVLNGTANLFLRAVGIEPVSESARVHSEEELRLILAESTEGRALPEERAAVLMNVMQLAELQARNVMTPRPRMVILDASKTFEENLETAETNGYTRYPLIDGTLDNVIGMVHLRDLITLARSPTKHRDIQTIRRDIHVVPSTLSAEALLRDMLAKGRHMGIVVDEHGGTAGVVTLEDVFEELFGDIRDEFDESAEALYRKLGENHYVLDGALPLHEAEDVLGIAIESEEVTTIGGFVIEILGHLPTRGERFDLGTYNAVVRDADRRRVRLVEVWLAETGE